MLIKTPLDTPHLFHDRGELVGSKQVRHFTVVEYIVDVLEEALVLDLRVGHQEHLQGFCVELFSCMQSPYALILVQFIKSTRNT